MVFSQVGYRVAEDPENLTLSWLFFAVAGLALSIACINVANLLLSTAPARMRETAVRLAMGASRVRLLRQFVIESAVLSTGGTIAGLGIAAACASFIRSIEIASNLPLKVDARVDLRVVLFGFAIGLTSGVLAGLLPAIRGTRADLNAVLKSTELRFARSRGRMRQALVVAQVAVALVDAGSVRPVPQEHSSRSRFRSRVSRRERADDGIRSAHRALRSPADARVLSTVARARPRAARRPLRSPGSTASPRGLEQRDGNRD